jgi:lantibiotic modifying enzyme
MRSRSSLDSEQSLAAARRAAGWIRSAGIDGPDGPCWPVAPSVSSDCADDLYSGGAGVVVFLLELDRLSPSDDLRAAVASAVPRLARAAGEGPIGLYDGAAGIAWVLAEVFRLTGDTRALGGARAAVDRLGGLGDQGTDSTDVISGSAGIVMALLRLAAVPGLEEASDLAVAAGGSLLARAEPAPGGVQWRESPAATVLMPNFAHGTAGVACSLAMLARDTGDDAFLDAAVAGAETLCRLAGHADDEFLVPHHLPGGEGLFYRGWCHGPAGTARLFVLLHQLTGEGRWLDLVHRCARSVVSAGPSSPGFWNNDGLCCGSAGAADFLLAAHRLTGEPTYEEAAHQIAAGILGRATRTSDGVCWPHAEHRVRPDEVAAQTGLMQGAAGIGLLLLRLHHAPALPLPDDPTRSLPVSTL